MWQGKWIWCDGEAAPRNFYLYLRRTFGLPARPKSAVARVCADSEYKLLVNGRLVCRGPVRSHPWHQFYDEIDLAPYLKRGRNTIAALVHHHGEDTFRYILGRGGFLFDCPEIGIASDDSWRVKPADEWARDIPRIDLQLGFYEVWDSKKAAKIEGWAEAGFDDAKWRKAVVIASAGDLPWTRLVPRNIPFLSEHTIYPMGILETGVWDLSATDVDLGDPKQVARCVWAAEHRIRAAEIRNAEGLVRFPNVYEILASDAYDPDGMDIGLLADLSTEANEGRPVATIRPLHGGRGGRIGPYVIVDFGAEVFGYPFIRIASSAGGVLDLAYAEQIKADRLKFHEDVRLADRIIMRRGPQSWEAFDKRAFRYLEMDFRNCPGAVKIEEVGVRFSTYPVKWLGSFHCSDPTLEDIWRIGSYTVQLNMDDGYTDCPWRERAQWWGDARVEALINYYAFGDHKLADLGIRQIALSQHEDGITNCFAPGGMGPCTPIPSFTLLWIISVMDCYRFSGRVETVKQVWPNVKKALGWFEKHSGEHGLTGYYPDGIWNFLDWEGVDLRGYGAAVNCLYHKALRDSAEMAAVAGDPDAAKKYAALAEKVKASINKVLFDEEKGVYRDCFCDGELSEVVSQQTNSLAILFDIAPREKWDGILDYIYDRGKYITNPKNVVPAGSPYFSFYLLGALWHAGRGWLAMEYIRRKWGEMLAWGATTWWESWHRDASICHGWSGAPTFYLPAYVLGVTPLAPGFKRLRIAPTPLDLEWAEGRVPTPHGPVDVTWSAGSGFGLEVCVPSGCTAEIVLPDAGIPTDRIRVNNRRSLPDGVKAAKPVEGKPAFVVEKGGRWRFGY